MSDKGYACANFINRQSFIELDARERAAALFDAGTSRELVGPFDRVESPHGCRCRASRHRQTMAVW